jgi:hypothetical protein
VKSFLKLTVIFILIFQLNSTAQNLILNGSFEEELQFWEPVEWVSIVQNPVYSGLNSLSIFTYLTDKGFISQNLLVPSAEFEASVWIYPGSSTYDSMFEIVAKWAGPTADFIARIQFDQNYFYITSLEKDTTIQNPFIPYSWNHLEIKTDQNGLVKNYYVNNSLVCSLTNSETIILGDVSRNIGFGTLY